MKHEHLYRSIGVAPTVLRDRERAEALRRNPRAIGLAETMVHCIVMACDCGDHYLTPINEERIENKPEWAE
jgi:hypothetical protein